ncbi:MAG TPA: hypothetical protein VHQ45_07130 [Gemmatimonadaceae bacterium]|jgi:uncharacterized membrane protein YagU involved in acid resistance|nr:hypothetical protein [Gemmatimonadaceae bacterium]
MTTSTIAPTLDRPRATAAVLLAGVSAGILDILAAFVSAGARGTGPSRVLQAIASGVLGRAAFRAGPEVAALGLLLHFVIALGWAAIYYAASLRLPVLVRRPVASGALYGILVAELMHRVVVPLSAAPSFAESSPLRSTLIRLGIHVVCVGLPIALVVARYARREGRP